MAAYETLEQGARVHGMDDAAIDGLIAELKEAVAEEEKRLREMQMEVKAKEGRAGPGIGKASGEKKPAEKKESAKGKKSAKSIAEKEK
jgi:hypothetical protein